MRIRTLLPAAVLMASTAMLTACGPAYQQAPAGTVADKDSQWHSTGKSGYWKRYLTVRAADGGQHRIRVEGSVYDGCKRGSAYPACAGR